MQVILQIVSATNEGRRIWLRNQQKVQVGRTQWADFVIEEDPSLAEIHFLLECNREACILTSLSPTAPTWVNGSPVENCRLSDGDLVTAGNTQFRVDLRHPNKRPSALPSRPAHRSPSTDQSYVIQPCASGLNRYAGGSEDRSSVAREISSRAPLALVVNFRHAGVPMKEGLSRTSDLLAGLSDVIRADHLLMLLAEEDGIDLFGMLARSWGKDAIIGVFSKLEKAELLESLRHVAPSYLSPSFLRKQLGTAPALFVRQLLDRIHATMVESESGDQWLVFGNPDLAPTWQDVGLLTPPVNEH